MKHLLILITFLSLNEVFGQQLIKKVNGELSTSVENILESRLNGSIQIKDIFYLDQDFNCLKHLGEPKNFEEDHSIAGDDYTFEFDGLVLFYSNVASGEELPSLSYLELNNSNSFLSSNSGNIQIPRKNSDNYKILDYKTNNSDFSQDKVLIRFIDDEGSRIEVEKIAGTIEKIKIYFVK